MIDAAILAGGLGTRLRGLLGACPKVLAPVAGRPFLAYVLDHLGDTGVTDVVLCTGYLGEEVQQAFGDRHGALRLAYCRESEPRGTAGALRSAAHLLRSDPVLVLNGDSYCDTALCDFVHWYRTRIEGAAGALLVTRVDDAARYGTVDFAEGGAIISFREKTGHAAPGWINAGTYLLSRRLVMSIPAGRAMSLERDVFPDWVGRGLAAYPVEMPFLDIGTPESYAQADAFFAERGRTIALM